MIEKNLTDLDKDFMIAWAKYCLSNDYSEISRQIQFLAEQNQINAIQSWYQFNKIGDNRIIDTNVSALNGYTFNECFVEANVQYSKDEQLFLQMRNECIEIDKAMDCVEDVRRIEYLRQKMSEFAFLKLYAKTINMAIGEFKVSKNPAILERADELCYYGFYILFQKPSLELRLRHRKTVSLLRKALKKAEKSQNAAKKDEILIYKFALAKALYLFDFSKDSKQVAEGRMLLAEFATMQYSNSPKAYVASAVQQQELMKRHTL
ncbi:MAG: hypothetical protein IJA69_01935 [Clostridia bacterium]|nr:hypothetical protein [Clostridia bacterium]